MEAGTGFCGDGGQRDESAQGEEAVGLVEAEAGGQLAGGGSEDSAAERGIEGAEAFELDGDGLGLAGSGTDGAAAATDGFAGEQKLGEDASEFKLPTGFFFASQLGEVGEGLVEGGVFGAEERQDAVANAVTGEGFIGVGGIGAVGLV